MRTMIEQLLIKDKYGFADLVDIMKLLRSPGGCPWDKEQTHASIRRNFIEETYEVIEAIDLADDALLKEELGDVLLQVVFHAQMADEEDAFSIDDVTDGICKKLIHRHPHIFGSVQADSSETVLRNWDEIKKQEKGQKSQSSVLESVPRQLPALMRSFKVQHKAAKVGFDWPDAEGAIAKLKEETEELCEALEGGDAAGVEEELGDLLFSVVNTARKLDVEPEEALTKACDKFVARFKKVESAALSQGRELSGMSLAEMDKLWDEVKAAQGK